MGKSLLLLRYKLNTVYMFFSFLVAMDLEDKIISYFTKTKCLLLYNAFENKIFFWAVMIAFLRSVVCIPIPPDCGKNYLS